jgi:tRNA modification GTPase
LERLGIAKTRERLAEANLALIVLDITASSTSIPHEIMRDNDGVESIIVFNKSDLRRVVPVPDGDVGGAPVCVSAKTGAGIDELIAAIVRRADSFQNSVGGDAVAVNARHAEALRAARECLHGAQQKFTLGQPIELVASDLRSVLAAYGEIGGKVDNERMLDQLFATFCIGK